VKRKLLARWRANFLAGLILTLPALISIGVLAWLFKTVSGFTDGLLFFVPTSVTHTNHGLGPIHKYWSAVALFLAIFLICLVGLIGRYYFGKQMIDWVEDIFMRVPVLNKIYGATKQFNDAFASGNKNSFKTVALVEFPRAGMYSLGFVTGQPRDEVQAKTNEKVVSVFVPTTPNPTAGFLVIVPEDKVVKLEMSVGEALKYIVSLGSIEPEYEVKTFKPPGGNWPSGSTSLKNVIQ
jgi:uncharacterized membrane protein